MQNSEFEELTCGVENEAQGLGWEFQGVVIGSSPPPPNCQDCPFLYFSAYTKIIL